MKKSEFDKLIKTNLNESTSRFGYELNGELYENYYSKIEFEKYKFDLKLIKLDGKNSNAYDAYTNGKGNELEISYNKKNGKWYPPKMASVASSSRFAIESILKATTKNLSEVFGISENYQKEAEKGVPFQRGGIAPQIDAYLCDKNNEIFIETKCHEIFDSHVLKMSSSYLLHFKEFGINYLNPTIDSDDNFTLDKSLFGYKQNEILRFDAKQAISHILGVKKKRLLKTKLIFLFFKPCNDGIYNGLINQIHRFILSPFIQTIVNEDFDLEFAFQQSIKMEFLSIENYKPFIIYKNNIVKKIDIIS